MKYKDEIWKDINEPKRHTAGVYIWLKESEVVQKCNMRL